MERTEQNLESEIEFTPEFIDFKAQRQARLLAQEAMVQDFNTNGIDTSDHPLAWQKYAACQFADPEAFFPEKGGSTREAKKTCQQCVVRTECLDYALKRDERFGIWGGLSERERATLKRRVF